MDEPQTYDVIIVGQGAAAYSAALYAARYQIKPLMVGTWFGGETATGGAIENYPGYVEIDGLDLMLHMQEQAKRYEVPVETAKVESITREDECFLSRTDNGDEFRSNTVILAMGRERRKLGIPKEDEWTGHGVSFCSTCDAPLYRGKSAVVVGGGDAAVKGATLLSKYADKVYVLYRGKEFVRPEPINVRQLEAQANAEVLFNTSVIDLKGQDGVTGVVLDRAHNGSNEIDVDGIFIEIGADPNFELAKQLGVELNELNEVDVDKMMKTNVPGVFAAGDITNGSGELKQTITAAAQGALAATSAYEYSLEHPFACKGHAVGHHRELEAA